MPAPDRPGPAYYRPMTDEPRMRLEEARRLLDSGDPGGALNIVAQLTGHPDRDLVGEAWLIVGTARYRMDDEPGALAAWQQAALAGGSNAWLGWKSVAEQYVRDGDIENAIAAYREADRRAPADERGPIANRLAWLLKETGHDFASRRQFNRARGPYSRYAAYVTWTLIGLCIAAWIGEEVTTQTAALGSCGVAPVLVSAGAACEPGVLAGEWWRLLTYAFLHDWVNPLNIGSNWFGLLHIGFNVWALYLIGPVMEEIYGHLEYLVIYVFCALGGGLLSVIATPNQGVIGASGALFGLVGLGFVVWRRHHMVLGPQARALLSQMGTLLLLNLVITFTIPGISWTGHLGGLAVGAVIGLLLAPRDVTTLGGMWRMPDGSSMQRAVPSSYRLSVYGLLLAVLAVGTWLVMTGTLG
jgi:membrane associated rhomboid family serine protease